MVAGGLAGSGLGLAAIGEGFQGVADGAGAAVQRLGDRAGRAGAGVLVQVGGDLAAQLAVAEPARGRGARGGGGQVLRTGVERGRGRLGGAGAVVGCEVVAEGGEQFGQRGGVKGECGGVEVSQVIRGS